MKIGYKKLEDRAIEPTYATEDSAGFDFYALDTVNIPAGKSTKIRTGIALDIPKGYEVQIRPRSGLSATTSLRVSNSPGTIDSDYKKEIYILLDNINQNVASSIRVDMGDRIAQGVLVPIIKAEFEEQYFEESNRDGFGSTGK